MNPIIEFKIGDVVTLKTRKYEQTKTPILSKYFCNDCSRQNREFIYETSFIPPIMVVIELRENTKQHKKHYDSQTKSSQKSTSTSKFKVKCQYYDRKDNKFSEKEFIPEALEKL